MTRLKSIRVFCVFLAVLCVAMTGLVGCGSSNSNVSSSVDTAGDTSKQEVAKPITLTFASLSTVQQGVFEKLNITEAYKKVNPNVTIEIEKFKDSTEFENALKIRKTANELPDVFNMKPYSLPVYKDDLLPLDDLDAAKNNLYGKSFAIDGKIMALPSSSFNEFVYYSKSIYKEYNLSVPKTWGQFVDNAKKIKEGGKYIPILLGQKDDWVNYPWTELSAPILANDGFLCNTITTQDEPFSKGQPFYTALERFKNLADAKVFGSDPLGAGYDQVKSMLLTKKGAQLAAGAWMLPDIKDQAKQSGLDINDIGTYFMPIRDNETDPFRILTYVDDFTVISKSSENVEACKEFLNWYFGKDWYPTYMKEMALISTVKDIDVEMDPIFQQAYDSQKDAQPVVYDGGNTTYQKMANAAQLSVKKMGQGLVAGKDLDEMMADINKAWKSARAEVK
ncbi:MAG: ABC transporter substrate-binding protein [Ruminiclostridium sp.]